MQLRYRGINYERSSQHQLGISDEVVGLAIFELKYRGTSYWNCRQRTSSGSTFEVTLSPIKSKL